MPPPVKHTASTRFWRCYQSLPRDIQQIADKNFALLKADPTHPSLQFKLLSGRKLHSVRVGLHYRGSAVTPTMTAWWAADAADPGGIAPGRDGAFHGSWPGGGPQRASPQGCRHQNPSAPHPGVQDHLLGGITLHQPPPEPESFRGELRQLLNLLAARFVHRRAFGYWPVRHPPRHPQRAGAAVREQRKQDGRAGDESHEGERPMAWGNLCGDSSARSRRRGCQSVAWPSSGVGGLKR